MGSTSLINHSNVAEQLNKCVAAECQFHRLPPLG
jgi:hypothetical protein